MKNLRIVSLKAQDSTTLIGTFTDQLARDLDISNVEIIPQAAGIPTPQIKKINILGATVEITTQPLTPLASYNIIFKSATVKFRNLNSTAFLIEDGKQNSYLFLGPEESSNPILSNFLNYFRDNIYNVDPGTINYDILSVFSKYIARAMYDIRQLKNENYLKKTVTDEVLVRGSGPFDHLAEEGAYEVLRVSKTPTGFSASETITIDSVPEYLISLRQQEVLSENLAVSSTDVSGSFNINSFNLTVKNVNVIKLEKVVFFYNTLLPNNSSSYEYDISTYGYQLLDGRYDKDYGSEYLTLGNNQFHLSDQILKDNNFSLTNINYVQVSYLYKNKGRIVDSNTVKVRQNIQQNREVLDPLVNVFNLKNAPILDSTGNVATLGGVSFQDPNSYPQGSKTHPAFSTELLFTFENLPSKIGEYSVDYNTGTVYVFGEDSSNQGTGAYPALATYTYQYTYQLLTDYVYDADECDFSALPNREILGQNVSITFDFQDVLVPDVDYKALIHKEVLSERIQNRIFPSTNSLKVKNTPITNVFKVFNETQGQTYSVTRWSDDRVYFNFPTEPNIATQTSERVSFNSVMNEVLFVNQELTNNLSNRIFEIHLQNNNIVASTEDCVACSFNTSLVPSSNLFKNEKYYDNLLTVSTNINRLTVGDYTVNYLDGIVYLAVQSSQNYDIGTVSYKSPYILPQNPHILSPVDIFFQRNVLQPKDKSFAYQSFSEGSVLPASFELSNESYLNGDSSSFYYLLNGSVGAFLDGVFTPGVSSNISFVRGLYEQQDLLFNPSPINFNDSVSSDDKSIDVYSKTVTSAQVITKNGSQYLVNSGVNLQYLSPNISINFSVKRLSDSVQLWNGSGTYQLGQPMILQLSGTGSPQVGDAVMVSVTFTINNSSRVTVDYDRGGLYMDYTYLGDEIIVSYEYGDNQLDFRESDALSEGDTYYVTYRVGALRDALLKNFGALVDIPIFTVFDENFERERYRDSLLSALSSFVLGPTTESMRRIVSTITHVDPDINESAFENWSLGNSVLYPSAPKINGKTQIAKGKFGNGFLPKDPGQAITLPLTSNLKLESGTFSTWITPQWNGLDNDAQLNFYITENGVPVSEDFIFIGAAEYHPEYQLDNNGKPFFTVSKRNKNSVLGTPNKKKNGVFIYLDKDGLGNLTAATNDGYVGDGYDGYVNYVQPTNNSFYRWYCDVVDTSGTNTYQISILSDGDFFDSKLIYKKAATDSIASATNKITFTTKQNQQGISFLSDLNHYIFDLGQPDKNRLSLFKDAAGYLNFRVIDRHKNQYRLSADISSWRANQNHHVAVSWSLNSKGEQDEMHLFVDGAEVPNIVRYGQGFPLNYGQKYRTVNPEEIVSLVTRPIVSGDNMTTTAGSPLVTAFVSFTGLGILPGDTLYINEFGFNSNGYTVSSVSGNNLTLSSNLPVSLTNASFTLNKVQIPVLSRIDIFPSTAVYLVHPFYSASNGIISGNTLTSASSNFISLGVTPGNLIRVESAPENHYVVATVSANQLTFTQTSTITGTYVFYLYKDSEQQIPGIGAIVPYYSIGKDSGNNNIITLTNGAQKGDLVRVKTFGNSFKQTRQTYYSWGSDGYVGSNIIRTHLPPPVSLDDVKIKKVIIPSTLVSSSNSTFGAGVWTYVNSSLDLPCDSDLGRTLEINTSGPNVDWSTPTTIQIVGSNNSGSVSETLTFSAATKKTTTNKFKTISSVTVVSKPLVANQASLTFSIKEANSMMVTEGSVKVAKIQFSYQVKWGNSLSGSGQTLSDSNGFFSSVDVGNYVHVFSGLGAGYYKISAVSTDHKSVTITPSAPTFSNAIYEILNTTTERSGLQNGVFKFENAAVPGQIYPITKGLYEINYPTYISTKLDPINGNLFIGSDIDLKNQVNAVIDEVVTESFMKLDTKLSEVSPSEGSITVDFNSLKPRKANNKILALLHMEDGYMSNDAKYYLASKQKYLQSGKSVNGNFSESILINEKPLKIDNLGVLNAKKEGTIEFWISPLADTANDPNYRFYFDASGIVTETVVSQSRTQLSVSGNVGSVVSVKIKNDNFDKDYFGLGSVDSDKKTITLQSELPYQNTKVYVSYIPTGLVGDRVSIYKDPYGFLTFNVRANNTDYQIRTPIFWTKNSWHRVKVTFKVNGGKKQDQIHLFVDGLERGNIMFGSGLLFGQNLVYGQSFVGQSNIITTIKFTDQINELNIGSDYSGNNVGNCLIDNLRISDISRPAYIIFGEPIDVHYNKNTSAVYPVTKDLYTTYLSDFDQIISLAEDFSLLKKKNTGNFDFSLDIYDLYDIVKDSPIVKQVLETLINTLKPANSRVSITYK